jgi:hypothetical protein
MAIKPKQQQLRERQAKMWRKVIGPPRRKKRYQYTLHERKLLAYWQAARLEREHAARKAPPKAHAHHSKLGTAPWTLAGGAVETNRRQH